MNRKSFIKTVSFGAAVLLGSQSWAGGFEKSVMIGGKSAGLAGIATPYASGAESLYFNPAGLARDNGTQNITLNLSPFSAEFKAPITADNTQSTSEHKTLIPLGLMYNRALTDKLGVGIGYYVSGGSNADFKDLTLSGVQGTAEAKTDLQITELALGAGYKLTDNFKIGVSYRIVMAQAEFATISPVTGGNYLNLKVSNLKDTAYTGFKLGAQYKISDSTLLGFTYRSDVPLKAKGNMGGQLMTSSGDFAVSDNSAEVKTTFPDAYTLGIQQKLCDAWNLYGEYVYTVYSRNQTINVDGTVHTTPVTVNDPALKTDWRDETDIRLAAEYTGLGMPIRFGYIWSSQVTDNQFARPTFVPPGTGNTITLGTGAALGDSFGLDGGLEYSWVSGSGHTGESADTRAGDYKVTEYALHLGASYAF